MPSSFIHLRVHTEYSLVDSLIRIKPLVKAVATQQMPAVAVTDNVNLFAAVKFYQAARAAGVKPILGADLCVANSQDINKPFRLTLLCQNKQGYLNLSCLISRAYREGQRDGKPLLQKEWLLGMSDGLIALSGGREGEIGQALLNNQMDLAQQLASEWQQLFPERYYLELQRTGRSHEEEYIQAALEVAHACDLPIVATNDVRFLKADDFAAHEARTCIQGGWVLDDPRRPLLYSPQQYLRSPAEMAELFADLPEALLNTVEIAKRCNLELELGKSYLPNFPIPPESTLENYMSQVAQDGLAQRFTKLFEPNLSDYAQRIKPYHDRLQMELGVINSMGFAGYFLIVADFIQWAKDNEIPVGPGRGSGAGSLVAYALKITDIDPLQYELLFERFLNPERISMPDFDIDFCMEGRDRVIDYVTQKYGRDSVSQIITYGTMAAKAVVRDVGRVLAHPYGFVDKLAKLIPFELGITLEKALAQEPDLRNRYDTEEDVRDLFDLALKLEGLTRNAGKHAGGVVIAPSSLTDFTPLFCEPEGQHIVTQYDKNDVEAVGLVKFDFLGLRTLTIIDWATRAVNQTRQRKGEAPLDISLLPTDDPATYRLLKACTTTAIFQLESRGMKDLIKRLQPDCFEEIIALVALFRPGPLQSGMVDDFINRKHGRAKVEYPHPELQPILSSTYGVILYQEQVMQIAQTLAGYTLGGADLLRKAMGKKKPEEMAKQRAIFVTGATGRGIEEATAAYIFDLMEKFAGYGFNKSHSAAYALVTYQTAWLKTHYPAEFMAAVLSSDMDNTDKVVGFIADCREMKLEVLPPAINYSAYKFSSTEEGCIRYGLGAIKGVGEAAIASILNNRTECGPFKNLYDFCQRIDLRKANRRVLEALIRSGALDELGLHRACLWMTLDAAIQQAEHNAKQQSIGQDDLFGSVQEPCQDNVASIPEWPMDILLLGEKETLGHYLSGHPIQPYVAELKQFTTSSLAQLQPTKNQGVIIAGLISAIRTMQTKRGDRIAFITLDDGEGRADLAVFGDLYQNHKELIIKDQLLIAEGEVSIDDYTGGYKISARRLLDIQQARAEFIKSITLQLDGGKLNPDFIRQLEALLMAYQGGHCFVHLDYQREEFSLNAKFGPDWQIRPVANLLQSLESLLCSIEATYKIIYHDKSLLTSKIANLSIGKNNRWQKGGRRFENA